MGTLKSGIPLVLLDKSLRSALDWLYAWKNVLLAVTLLPPVLIYRSFCKYICSLGAIYPAFNPIPVFQYRVDENKCTRSLRQGMQANPAEHANHSECIRCGQCTKVRPAGVITWGFLKKQNEKTTESSVS